MDGWIDRRNVPGLKGSGVGKYFAFALVLVKVYFFLRQGLTL